MNRWIAALAAVTIVVAGGLWYTTRQVGSPPEPPKPVVRDSVVIGMALEPPGLDPTIAPAAAIGEITHLNIFEGLTKIPENGEVAQTRRTAGREHRRTLVENTGGHE